MYAGWFGVEVIKTEGLEPNYNVAPTDEVYAIAEHGGSRQLGTFRWGLIPHYSKDRKGGARLINARLETVAEKPAFRDSFVARRCLVPADGFYEWEPMEDRSKLPHFIYDARRRPLAFAGLWASWLDPEYGKRVRTCTILTGEPDPLVRPIHDRMPVMLARELWNDWLDPGIRDPDRLLEMLHTRPDVALTEHAVSSLVNDVRHNGPELITPLRPKPQ